MSFEEDLELPKLIYGLADSIDEWHRNLDDHVQIDLKMIPTLIDLSLHYQFENEQLVGIHRSYANDLLRARTDDRTTQPDATLEWLKTTENKHAPLTLAEMHTNEPDILYRIFHDFYMGNIEQILSNTEFVKFASMRMKLAWLPNKILDIVFEISTIAHVTRAMHGKDISKYYKALKQGDQMYTWLQGIY